MDPMTKENYLTVRWNNWLTLGLGIPTLVYAFVVSFIIVLSDFEMFVGMAIFGAFYCTVVELHAERRIIWRRKNFSNPNSVKLSFFHPFKLIHVIYNIIYLMPLIFPLLMIIDYYTGFLAVFVVIIIRSVANLYRNNILTWEQAENFPFRI